MFQEQFRRLATHTLPNMLSLFYFLNKNLLTDYNLSYKTVFAERIFSIRRIEYNASFES